MNNFILNAPMAGSIANTKDLHCGDESIQSKNLAVLKCGYACMLDEKGEVVVSDGSSFYGVRSEGVPSGLGATIDSATVGVRRKGIVHVVFSGGEEVAKKVKRGSKLKIANDGTFTLSEDGKGAVGIAYLPVTEGVVALEFNADCLPAAGGGSKDGGVTEQQVDTKVNAAKTELETKITAANAKATGAQTTADTANKQAATNKEDISKLDTRVKTLEKK